MKTPPESKDSEGAFHEGEVARALATKLANGPTVAYATMKRNIATALDQNLQMVLLAEAEAQRVAGGTKDAMEGGMSFLQKRKPEFKGH